MRHTDWLTFNCTPYGQSITDACGVSVYGMSRGCMCIFSLVELIRWRRTAREPTLLRSLLFSIFWRTNKTSRSGNELARRGRIGSRKKEIKIWKERSEKKGKTREKSTNCQLIWLSCGGDRVWHANRWSHYCSCDSIELKQIEQPEAVGQHSAVSLHWT